MTIRVWPHMPGEARRGMEQERTAGNGFGRLAGVGQAHEQAPPVIGQRREAGHEAAAFHVLGGETAPAPVVLELVERISASARSRYIWATARISPASEVASTAYS